jgi:hypothetical protein
LFVSCSKTIDFSKIYNVNEGTLSKIKFVLERYFSIYGTPVGVQMPIPEVKGKIIAQDLSYKKETGTHRHEEQHAVYDLITKAHCRVNTAAELVNPEEKEVENNLRENAINDICGNIGDELLAQVAEKVRPKESGQQIRLDYLSRFINFEIRNLTIGLMDAKEKVADSLVKKTQEDKINEVIKSLKTKDFNMQMLHLINNSTRAISLLFKNNYSRAQVLALFSNEDTSNWLKLANRLAKDVSK